MKKRFLIIIVLYVAGFSKAISQTNVGSTAVPDASAAIQVTSTTQGFRPPQVSLTSSTTFGLTAFATASAAYGMVVYNTNAAITGSLAYPAYGKGLYTWDGTGWVAPSQTPIVFCAGNGSATSGVANNAATGPLDLGTSYIKTADVAVSGNNTVSFVTAGTYKIDICVVANFAVNNTSSTGFFNLAITNSGGGTYQGRFAVAPVSGGTSTTVGANYFLQYSYIMPYSASSYLTIKGLSYAISGTGQSASFQVQTIQITRVK
jgi:hypothetical protein